MIYADNAATTKLDIDAFEAMKPYLLEDYANPSGAYSFSKKAKRALKEARQTIAECINAEPEQIIFTSGGTESNNHAIKHFTVSSDICHVVTSAIDMLVRTVVMNILLFQSIDTALYLPTSWRRCLEEIDLSLHLVTVHLLRS